jgi:hypothetical protein
MPQVRKKKKLLWQVQINFTNGIIINKVVSLADVLKFIRKNNMVMLKDSDLINDYVLPLALSMKQPNTDVKSVEVIKIWRET